MAASSNRAKPAPRRSGALITADLALEQGRDLFVVPGNADSPNSAGSNALLRDCARAVTTGTDILSEYEGLYPNAVRPVKEIFTPPEKPASFQTRQRAAFRRPAVFILYIG